MAYLTEAAAIIAAGTTAVGTAAGWPVYLGHMPSEPAAGDQAVALLQTGGSGTMGGVDVEEPGLQVLVRGAPMAEDSSAYPAAERAAVAVRDAIHGYVGRPESTGHRWVGAWNVNGPEFIGFDEAGRPLLTSNYRIMRSTTT